MLLLLQESISRLASALTSDLTDNKTISQEIAVKWLSNNHLFIEILDLVMHYVFQLPFSKGKHLVPMCRGVPSYVRL